MKSKKTWFFDYGMVVVLFALVILFSIISENFFQLNTFFTILNQVAVTGVISVGMAFVILTGGIDLSSGAIVGMMSVLAASLMSNGVSIFMTCIICLSVGALCGAISGSLITFLDVPPLIATLGVQISVRGFAYIISSGLPIFNFSTVFKNFGQGRLWFIPYPVLLLAVIFIIGKFILTRTVFGKHIYGVGGNAEASRLSGINVRRIILSVYTIAGLLAAMGGLSLLSRNNSGQPTAGINFEMNAITAVVLGGVSLSGGRGNLSMVLVGVIIMGVLSTGMIMMGIQDYVQQVIRGVVLVGAVVASIISSKMRNNNKSVVVNK